MDSLISQPTGFKPYNAPPCPGCAQNATGQPGPRTPAQTSQPLFPPRPDLLAQTPTDVPMGPNFGTGALMPQTGAMPQTGVMPQAGAMPQTGVVPQAGAMPQTGVLPQTGAIPQARTMPQAQPGVLPSTDLAPIVPWNQPMPVTTESLQYMNGFMRTQIGRKVTVEFLIGTNTLTDKTGTLLAVGANYIIINEVESDDILLCDFYSIKFMKFYY